VKNVLLACRAFPVLVYSYLWFYIDKRQANVERSFFFFFFLERTDDGTQQQQWQENFGGNTKEEQKGLQTKPTRALADGDGALLAWRGVLPVKDLFRDELPQDHTARHRRRGTEHRRAPVVAPIIVAPTVVTTTPIARMRRIAAALDITRTTGLLIVVYDRSGLRREHGVFRRERVKKEKKRGREEEFRHLRLLLLRVLLVLGLLRRGLHVHHLRLRRGLLRGLDVHDLRPRRGT